MNTTEQKCVMVIDSALPLGLIANTAAMLGISIGKLHPEMIGSDVTDATGYLHAGISTYPISMLKGDESLLKELRLRLFEPEFSGLTAVDFSDVAQKINVYADFAQKTAETQERDHHYYGIALFGDKKKVNRLTGMLPLLRA
ncbi:MAG: DUF2000 domain-containing protein [Eubacteriales bacterium]|nr:DUF2000 domain-containing protein [Eubacteriales bacterium]